MTRTLYLCGAGNPSGVRLALTVNRQDERWDRIVLLDDDASKHGKTILDVPIVGPFSSLRHADPRTDEMVNLVARTTLKRWNARRALRQFGIPFASLIDPSVDMSGVQADRDITVYPNAIIGPETVIESSVVIFMGSAIGPGCRLKQCSIVAPAAVVNGRVEIGEGAYVGTHASIVPELTVGSWATVGTGSAAMFAVPAGATVVGVPAKVLPTPAATGPLDWEDEARTSAAAV